MDTQFLFDSRLSDENGKNRASICHKIFVFERKYAYENQTWVKLFFAVIYHSKFRAAKFKRSRKSLGDDERSGRPITVTTDKNIAKVHQMVFNDRRIKVRERAGAMKISRERVYHALNQVLGTRMPYMRCMSRLQTLDQKLVRMNICNVLLVQFRHDKSEF